MKYQSAQEWLEMMRERFDLEPMTDEEIERRMREIGVSPRFVAPVERAFDRHTEAFDRHTKAFERNARTIDEHNLFMREMTLRVEKVGKQMVRAIAHTAEETVREIRESRERWSAELHNDMQAQRDIALKIFDQLEDREQPPG